MPSQGELHVQPKPEFGEPSSWTNLDLLINAVNEGTVHPFDAKMAIAHGLIEILAPISKHFDENPELLDAVNKMTGG